MSVSWNPWHGCRKISEGCRNCYVYRQDSRHDKDSREVRQTAMFDRPVRRSRDGRFKVPAGEMVYTCFTSDFLLEEADAWRAEAWEMMRIRHDLRFLFFTKRIDRLAAVLPPDWGDGYENVVIGCTVENQAMADYRLLLFLATPVRHRLIVCAPLLGPLDIARYLSPPSRRSRRAANRATRPGRATTPGCSGCVNSAWRQTSPSASTRPGRGS